MDIANIIATAEQALGAVKPTILIDLLVRLYHQPTVASFAKSVIQLLELYDLYWTLDVDKLFHIKDAIFAFVKSLPSMCKDFAVFVGFSDEAHLENQGFFDAPFDTLKDFLKANEISASEWSKPVCVVATGILIIAGTVCSGIGLSTTDLGRKVTNFVRSTGTVFKNGEWIISGIKQLYNMVMTGLGSLFDFEVDTPTGRKLRLVNKISEKIEILEKYKQQCEIDMAEVMLDATMFDRITTDMKDIDRMYSEVAESDSNMSNVKTLLDKLRDLHALLNEQRQDILAGIAGKQQPTILWIAGITGVGKSRIVRDILDHLAVLENGGKRPLTVYLRTTGDKYWSKYIGQDVVFFDDFGSSKEDLDHFELNQIYTPSAYPLNCADIPNKGKCFSSRYVIICSNFYFIDRSEGIKNPEILDRRRDMLIDMQSPSLVDYKEKHSRMPPSSWYPDNWMHVNFYDCPILPKNGQLNQDECKKISWSAIAPFLYQKQLENRMEFKAHLATNLKAFKITSGESSKATTAPTSVKWSSASSTTDDSEVSFQGTTFSDRAHPLWDNNQIVIEDPDDLYVDDVDLYADAYLTTARDFIDEFYFYPPLEEQCILKTPGGFVVDKTVSWGENTSIEIPNDQEGDFIPRVDDVLATRSAKVLTPERAYKKARLLHMELSSPYHRSIVRKHRHCSAFLASAKENKEDIAYVMEVQDDINSQGFSLDEQATAYRDLYRQPEIMPVRPTGRILLEQLRNEPLELQMLGDAIVEVSASRIPIMLLQGVPGTGKTFTLRALEKIFNVTMIRDNPTIEELSQEVLLFDEIAMNARRLDLFMETVFEQYDNPSCLRIVATCNESTLIRALMNYDSEKVDAFYRRLTLVNFVFRKKCLWKRYTRQDIEKFGIDKCVKRIVDGQSYMSADLVKFLSPLPTLQDFAMCHVSVAELPATWFSHHIKLLVPFDEFYQNARENCANIVRFGAYMKGKFTIITGSTVDCLRIATKIFGAFSCCPYADRSTFEKAVVSFNNLNMHFDQEFQVKLEFPDVNFVFCAPKGKPCIGAFQGFTHEYLHHGTHIEERSDVKSRVLTGGIAAVAKSYILDFDSELRAARLLVQQQQLEHAEQLPFFVRFKDFFRGLTLLMKFGGSLALIAITNLKKKKAFTILPEGSWSDHMDQVDPLPTWTAPLEHRFITEKQPASKDEAQYEWVYDPFSRSWIRVLVLQSEAKKGKNFLSPYSEADVPTTTRKVELESCLQYAGPSSFLSNFHPHDFEIYGLKFSSVEQAYQYKKAMDCNCEEVAKKILQTHDPYRIKELAKHVSVTPEWTNARAKVMEILLRAKFSDPKLRDQLQETVPLELFHNVKDGYWGAPGRNVHGRLLMKIRFGLTYQEEYDSGLDYWEGVKRLKHKKTPVKQEDNNPYYEIPYSPPQSDTASIPSYYSSDSTNQRVIKKHRFQMQPEAMTDPHAAVCLDLCAANSVAVCKNGAFACYGLMIKGHLGVTVGHVADKSAVLTIVTGEQTFPAEVIKVNLQRDFCIFKVHKTCKQFKDITSQIATNSMMSADLSGNAAVLQTTKQTNKIPLQQQRVIYIRAVTTRTIAGMERFGIEYEGHLDHYEYSPLLTQKGDCGSPIVILNPSYQRKIIGIHSAGSTVIGFSSLLTVDMFEALLQEESVEPQSILFLPHQGVEAVQEDDYLKFGVVGRCVGEKGEKLPLYLPTKTRLWKSPFCLDIEGCAKFEPAILGQHDRRLKDGIDPFASAMDKWSHEQPDLDLDLLERCVDDIADHLATSVKTNRLEVRVLTKNQSLNRYTKIACSNPLHRQSSPGYPFRFWPGVDQKKTFLDQGEDGLWHISTTEHGRRLHNCIDALIDNARRGIRTGVVFSGALKDEPLKLKKIYDVCKTRSFAGSPLDYTIAHRMYFHAAAAAIAECRATCPPQVGIDPRTTEWDHLMRRLLAVSPFGFDADFAAWDSTVPRAVMEQLPTIYNRIYQVNDPCHKPEDDVVRKALHSCLHGPLMTYYGKVVQAPGGQVSGQPCTAIDNCLVNMIYMFYIWMRIAKQKDPKKANYQDFTKYVAYAVYGDDNITAISEKVLHWFNFSSFKEECEKHLLVSVTSAAKDDVNNPYRKIEELEFLKRHFKQRGKMWTGPLVKDSLVKMLGWTKTRKLHFADKDLDKIHFDLDTIGQTVECALEEACFHDEAFFNMLKDHFVERCNLYNIQMPRTYTYAAYFDRVYYNKNVSKEYNPSSF